MMAITYEDVPKEAKTCVGRAIDWARSQLGPGFEFDISTPRDEVYVAVLTHSRWEHQFYGETKRDSVAEAIVQVVCDFLADPKNHPLKDVFLMDKAEILEALQEIPNA